MKRHTAVRTFNSAMNDGDIGIFIGEGICSEVYNYDRPGNFYTNEYDNIIGMALGIAMCTDRRVFVFCDDSYFLRNISEVIHVAVSNCVNMSIIVLIGGVYSNVGKHPTICNSIRSLSGILFNMGFIVHDYKRHFKNMRNPVKEIRAIWAKIRGPFSVLLEVDPTIKSKDSDTSNIITPIEKLQEFIRGGIPIYNYVSPVSTDKFFAKEE